MRPVLLAALLFSLPALANGAHRSTHRAAPQAPEPPLGAVLSPFAQCDIAIGAAAKLPGALPVTLLPAIARVESGRLDGATGRVRPWPWTINVDGVGYFFDTKDQVVAAVQTLQAKGKKSIDVGCMQVNLMHHATAFADLDEAFDPASNARYAVQFLLSLYQMTKDWPLATAYYHSSTPDLGEQYQRLVFGRVMTPMGGTGGLKLTEADGTWPPAGATFAAIPAASFTFGAFAPQKPIKTTLGGVPAINIGSYPNLLQARPMGGPPRLPGAR